MATSKKSTSKKSISKKVIEDPKITDLSEVSEDVIEDTKELITTKSDVRVGLPLNKATSKKPAKPVKVEQPDEFIYNRSNRAVTIFKGGTKYVIPAKGKVRR